jgi:hypothetical protein
MFFSQFSGVAETNPKHSSNLRICDPCDIEPAPSRGCRKLSATSPRWQGEFADS